MIDALVTMLKLHRTLINKALFCKINLKFDRIINSVLETYALAYNDYQRMTNKDNFTYIVKKIHTNVPGIRNILITTLLLLSLVLQTECRVQ